MPDYPGIDHGGSEDIIIVGSSAKQFAGTYNLTLPDGSIAEIDSATDTITNGK